MKLPLPCFALSALLFALLATGCESTGRSARIQEKSAVFAALSPALKQQIQQGGVDLGFNQDMVYMALGRPTRTEAATNGKDTTWIFTNYYPPDSMRTTGVVIRRIGSAKTRNTTSTQVNTGGINAAQPETAMELPDMVSFTLFVVFRGNRVIDLWLGDEQ